MLPYIHKFSKYTIIELVNQIAYVNCNTTGTYYDSNDFLT